MQHLCGDQINDYYEFEIFNRAERWLLCVFFKSNSEFPSTLSDIKSITIL